MDRTGQRFIRMALILAGSMLASSLMLKLTPDDSWLAFVGWVIFFLVMQSPLLILTQTSQGNCTAWLSRLRRKGSSEK